MLTPGDIKKTDFTKAGRGTYKSIEVDAFLDEVYTSYAQLYKENGELIKKLQLLADRVESYRQDEDSIRSALLTAQRMADSILKEANEKCEQLNQASSDKAKQMLENAKEEAEKVTKDAQAESAMLLEKAKDDSQRMIENAKSEVTHEQKTLERMQKEVSVFRAHLMAEYKAHVELINALPTIYEDDDEIQLDETAYLQRKNQQETSSAVSEAEKAADVPDANEKEDNSVINSDSSISSFSNTAKSFPSIDSADDDKTAESQYAKSKNNNRFGTLKFGADYSVENDDEFAGETGKKKGFFKKK